MLTTKVTINERTVAALQAAAELYRGISRGSFIVFNRERYRFFEPKPKDMREKAEELTRLARELNE